MRPSLRYAAFTLGALALSTTLAAAPVFEAGADGALDAHLARHLRQFYAFNALPFGLSLDAMARGPEARLLIDGFLADEGATDVQAVTGAHAFDLLADYGEHGDLGQFGGVPLAALAFQYQALKRDGAPAGEVTLVRQRLVRAARSWHVFYRVTGGEVVARGVRRLVPEEAGSPPIPGPVPDLVPLVDAAGQPLPEPKDNGSWRADLSGGELPAGTWIWVDSCSKDQLLGQVFALVALYDALEGDPDVDPALVADLQADARLVGRMLRVRHEVAGLPGVLGEGLYDLIIFDADGRPTFYHDLNPRSLEKIYVPPTSNKFNVFNLFMALGIVKGLFHVTGDDALEAYLYDELLGARDYLGLVERARSADALDYVWVGSQTNYDNPDMLGLALWLNLYLEADEVVAAPVRTYLEEGWWHRADETHSANRGKQPLWNALYLGLTDRGTDPALVAATRKLLLAFDLGPYWDEPRINCDEAELAAGVCLAVDGATLLTLDGTSNNGAPVADEALDPSIRPTSNYDARSNPFVVNGGGDPLRLNPGGDLLAAYWLLRWVESKPAGRANLSPRARLHRALPGGQVEPAPEIEPEIAANAAAEALADLRSPDASVVPEGSDGDPPASGAGGCAIGAAAPATSLLVGVALAGLLALRWRRGPRGR